MTKKVEGQDLLKNLLYSAVAIMTFGAIVPCCAQDRSPDFAVTISTKSETATLLGDVILSIGISNLDGHTLRVNTITAEPPVTLQALFADGQMAIINGTIVKDGTTRNVEYVLAPKETKTYKSSIKEMLTRWQKLSLDVGEVTVTATFPIVVSANGGYRVIQVNSNTLKIKIVPR